MDRSGFRIGIDKNGQIANMVVNDYLGAYQFEGIRLGLVPEGDSDNVSVPAKLEWIDSPPPAGVVADV